MWIRRGSALKVPKTPNKPIQQQMFFIALLGFNYIRKHQTNTWWHNNDNARCNPVFICFLAFTQPTYTLLFCLYASNPYPNVTFGASGRPGSIRGLREELQGILGVLQGCLGQSLGAFWKWSFFQYFVDNTDTFALWRHVYFMQSILQNVVFGLLSQLILTFSTYPKKSNCSLEAFGASCEGQLLRHVPRNNHVSACGLCVTIMLHIIQTHCFCCTSQLI